MCRGEEEATVRAEADESGPRLPSPESALQLREALRDREGIGLRLVGCEEMREMPGLALAFAEADERLTACLGIIGSECNLAETERRERSAQVIIGG